MSEGCLDVRATACDGMLSCAVSGDIALRYSKCMHVLLKAATKLHAHLPTLVWACCLRLQ